MGVSPVYGMPNVLAPSELCLSTLNGSCFSFFLFDFLGDGLSQTGNGNGYWRLRTESGADLMRDNFDGTVDGIFSPTVSPLSTWYTNGHPFCLPAGPTQPLPSECGIFTNNLQNKVYCKAIAGVTNYPFQFLRPDEGYSRQISVPRNWVKFGEVQTFPYSLVRCTSAVSGPTRLHSATTAPTSMARVAKWVSTRTWCPVAPDWWTTSAHLHIAVA
ncbi:MAG: hypothetical protein IPG69_02995 [Flavobacteriales bacterium]|nr:hypothetical protein [Flavobacteriales bacterium]